MTIDNSWRSYPGKPFLAMVKETISPNLIYVACLIDLEVDGGAIKMVGFPSDFC